MNRLSEQSLATASTSVSWMLCNHYDGTRRPGYGLMFCTTDLLAITASLQTMATRPEPPSVNHHAVVATCGEPVVPFQSYCNLRLDVNLGIAMRPNGLSTTCSGW